MNKTSYLSCFTVVRLLLSVSSGVAPVSGVALGGWSDLDSRSGPEPSVLIWWLQIWAVASSKVALASGRPDVSDVSAGNALLDEFVLLGRFHRDGVHTMATADVTGIKPVHFQVAGWVVLPAEEVRMGYTTGISVRGVPHA